MVSKESPGVSHAGPVVTFICACVCVCVCVSE
jgi:hypothetical protein